MERRQRSVAHRADPPGLTGLRASHMPPPALGAPIAALLAEVQGVIFPRMTLEELADLIRANSANTNGRIDRVVDHVRDLHTFLDRAQNETNAALLNVQNDLTDVRADLNAVRTDVSSMRQTLDLASTITAMRHEIDDLRAEVADLKRRAS